MRNILIIVVTRMTGRMGDDKDEFIHHWVVPKEALVEPAHYFSLTDAGDGLLLVHGHQDVAHDNSDLPLPKYKTIIADGILAVLNQKNPPNEVQRKVLEDFLCRVKDDAVLRDKPDYLTIVIMHRPDKASECNDYTWLEEQGCCPSKYSLLGAGGGPAPIVLCLRKAMEYSVLSSDKERIKKLTDLIQEKALNPAKLQIQYLHDIQELLLAIYLDAAVMALDKVSVEAKQKSEEGIRRAFQEIEQRVQSPAIQKLKPGIQIGTRDKDEVSSGLIYVIADFAGAPNSERGAFYASDNWKNKMFWQSEGHSLKKDNITLDVAALSEDIRQLSKSLQTLLKRVG